MWQIIKNETDPKSVLFWYNMGNHLEEPMYHSSVLAPNHRSVTCDYTKSTINFTRQSSIKSNHLFCLWLLYALVHIDLCAIEYSLGDALTALKHGDEACLHIWHLTWKLSTASHNLPCKLLTYKTKLLTKCSSAIWFLTIWTTWENSDFAWENLFKFII